jgi:DNA repair exonuclease SbcCD ATPase subunit
MQAILERSQNPILQRHNAILARYAQFDTNYAEIKQQLEELKTIKEQLAQLGEIKAVLERVASASTLDEVRASMEAVKDRVKKIEDSPAPGGPVLNGARNPYEKTNPYMPQVPTANARQIQRETLQRLHASGAFQNSEDQIAAAALMLEPMAGWE